MPYYHVFLQPVGFYRVADHSLLTRWLLRFLLADGSQAYRSGGYLSSG